MAHKLGPALIAGNGVVLKPSERTPLSGLALVELLLEAGVPSGRIAAIVTGPGVAEALVTDEQIDLISFTGGPRTPNALPPPPGQKILSELGGNNATIVCADADPIDAADAIVAGAFGVAGQNCSVQRVYVHTSLFERVLQHVARGTQALERDRSSTAAPTSARSFPRPRLRVENGWRRPQLPGRRSTRAVSAGSLLRAHRADRCAADSRG